jgi:hypothetical protein
MAFSRPQRLFNRHCLLTLLFFCFLMLVMYHLGEARTVKALGVKALEAVMAATVDLLFSLASNTG